MRSEYDFTAARRGAVAPVPHGKTRITIRLDEDVVAWFRKQVHEAGGGNYQTLINRALRRAMEQDAESLEAVVRRVVREEVRRPAARNAAGRARRR